MLKMLKRSFSRKKSPLPRKAEIRFLAPSQSKNKLSQLKLPKFKKQQHGKSHYMDPT